MTQTYTITLHRTLLPDKTLKRVKGHLFPDDMNPAVDSYMVYDNGRAVPRMLRQNPVKFMLVIFEDESKQIVNLDKFSHYTLSKELFVIQARQAEAESQGKANLR